MDYQRLTVINGCFFHRRRSSKYVKTDPVQWLVPQQHDLCSSALQTPPFMLHGPKLHTRDLTLLTSHSTRYPDTSHSTLHTILYALKLPTLHSELLTSHPTHWTRYTTPKSCARLPRLFACRSYKIGMFLQVPDEPQNLPPQNRCFVRGFRQFSSHVTKCHVCHVICAVSPLHSARQCDSQKNTQHDHV